jgi:alpha-glucosidase
MRFYTRVCREAAARKMLVDFHGGIRPILMARTWPNLLSTEGVQGLEHVKWSRDTEPEHDVTLPFTRMFIGPMDFTPGAMLNATAAKFAINFKEPMSMGTRCHQLAMYVVYESPLQMLADSPTHYAREPEAMEFLGPVPTVWDESRVLDGRIADYVVIARRHGKEWYLGAMTDWTARELPVDLSFLGDGGFQMTAYEDGPGAASVASDYRKTSTAVTRSTRLMLRLAPGGGWAARLRPQ